MTKLPAFFLMSLLAFTSLSVATDSPLSEEQADHISQQWASAKKRLNLTQEQQEQVKPILQKNAREREDMLKRHGFHQGQDRPALSFSQKRALLKESRALKNDTQQQMSKILSEEQMTEYKKIQDETRSRLKKHFKK